MNTNAVTTTDIIHAKIEKYSSEIIPDDKFNQKIFMLGIDNLVDSMTMKLTTKNIALDQTPHIDILFVNQLKSGSNKLLIII